MLLTHLLCLAGISGLTLAQTLPSPDLPSPDTALIVIENRNLTLKDNFYNTTISVPLDRPIDSPITIVDPKLLFHFYLLSPAPVSCTPLFDTVPATKFPTIIGQAFNHYSSVAPPEAADDLDQAKLRFWCSGKLSATASAPANGIPYADFFLEKTDPNNGTTYNETHTLDIGIEGVSSYPTDLSSEGVSQLIVYHVWGVDPNAVTCTPTWTTDNGTLLGRPFGIDESSGRPSDEPGSLGPKLSLACTTPDEEATQDSSAGETRAVPGIATDEKVATVLREPLDGDLQGSNVSYVVPIDQRSKILSIGSSRFYLANTTGVDINAVTCTTTFEQEPLRQDGGEFSLTVSTWSPSFVSSKAPGDVVILCENHLAHGVPVLARGNGEESI
ncbi:hypothetical protein PRZ48_006864 [Zasmidium cellare]|uniref:Uncharacterized protein n=1 Tax=Zasmidium cellare TaxID=395010 RepID=A0ABR0EIV3_ZASCE|nr:hypothetical protein PRZ48_006864 [Zasmidium cellare]